MEAVDLDRPVTINDVVHLLHVPARLGKGGVQLGDMGAVVRHALHRPDHEGPDTLRYVLEILIQAGDHIGGVAIGIKNILYRTLRRALARLGGLTRTKAGVVEAVLHRTDVVHIGVASARFP